MTSRQRVLLVAADDSPYGLSALKFACEGIAAGQDQIVVAHVRPQIEEKDFFGAEPYRKEFEAEYLKESEELLSRLKAFAESIVTAGITVSTVTVAGDPSTELQGLAVKLKPNLLVVGSHGKGLLKRALLGSVSRYLVHTAPCPVLVVKAPLESEASGGAAALIPGMKQLASVVQSAS